MKRGIKVNIEKLTLQNTDFRSVLYTANHCQLVLMSLKPKEEIGLEIHEDGDQFFRFEKGHGRVIIDETSYDISDGDSVIVPAGSSHNVMNTSETEDLKLYTIYAPPHHKDGIVRKTKDEAMNNEQDFDGITTE